MLVHIGFEPVAGNVFEMETRPMPGQNFSGHIRGEVLQATAPELLRITWNDVQAEAPTGWVISWRLRPEGRGTRILFSHTGFDPDDAIMQRARSIMSPGWAGMHDRLETLLAEAG